MLRFHPPKFHHWWFRLAPRESINRMKLKIERSWISTEDPRRCVLFIPAEMKLLLHCHQVSRHSRAREENFSAQQSHNPFPLMFFLFYCRQLCELWSAFRAFLSLFSKVFSTFKYGCDCNLLLLFSALYFLSLVRTLAEGMVRPGDNEECFTKVYIRFPSDKNVGDELRSTQNDVKDAAKVTTSTKQSFSFSK